MIIAVKLILINSFDKNIDHLYYNESLHKTTSITSKNSKMNKEA